MFGMGVEATETIVSPLDVPAARTMDFQHIHTPYRNCHNLTSEEVLDGEVKLFGISDHIILPDDCAGVDGKIVRTASFPDDE